MSKPVQTIQQTIQLIVDILSFEFSDEILTQQLENAIIDWDSVVIVASHHLVLPAVYCRLKQKALLNHLPEELILYLEELTQLNRDRNTTLLYEVREISNLFDTHKINHVFIKGMALLAGNFFKDHGERMIGDIDILVDSEDLDKAFEVLVEEGYSKFVNFNYEIKNYRHKPRQIMEGRLGAVELHDQLLKLDYNYLIDKTSFLLNKNNINGILVPNSEDLIKNTVFAQQVNDRGYYYNSFRLKGFYDVLAAGLAHNNQAIFNLSKQTYGRAFISLVTVFYPLQLTSPQIKLNDFRINRYLFFLNHPTYGRLIYLLKNSYIATYDRLSLLIFNKSYRKHIIKNKLIKSY